MVKMKDKLVPYGQTAPGFVAAYTGETSSDPVQQSQVVSALYTDQDGNVVNRWSTIPWSFADEEGHWQDDKWDDAVKHMCNMQRKLGPLSDSTRLLRCHISSLIPCDSGLPVTIDELLFAIARGKLEETAFKNGCMCSGLGCNLKTSQPRQMESIKTIHIVVKAFMSGIACAEIVEAYPEAKGFITRTYEWLGSYSDLSSLQKKMLERMLLTFEFFIELDYCGSDPQISLEGSAMQEMETLANDVFYDEQGRGRQLDAEISELTGLPEISPWDPAAYQTALDKLEDEQQHELYKTCCHIASGIHTASDCHHNTFRYIESWVHGVATGRLSIPTRNAQGEKQRLGQMLFGYALGLDRWLMRVPLQFLLLDLGHADLGFDPRNDILRVYACLGDEQTPEKEWLAACLWYSLVHNQQGGLIGSWTNSHNDLIQRCEAQGFTVHEWIDSALAEQSVKR